MKAAKVLWEPSKYEMFKNEKIEINQKNDAIITKARTDTDRHKKTRSERWEMEKKRPESEKKRATRLEKQREAMRKHRMKEHR